MKEPKYPKNEKGEFICPYCPNYTASRRNTMFYHLKTHEGEYPHHCKYCDCKFNYYKPLQYHIQSKHPEKLPKESQVTLHCPFENCSYETSNERDKRVHFIRKHCKHQISQIKETSDIGFQCKVCQRQFKSQDLFCYHAIDCLNKNEIPLLSQL